MEPRSPDRAQEAQIEPRMRSWSPGGPDRPQDVQIELRRHRWSPGGPDGVQEAQIDPRSTLDVPRLLLLSAVPLDPGSALPACQYGVDLAR